MTSANEAYHDRIAPRYDDVYGTDPYWLYYRDLSFEHMAPHLPSDMGPEVVDLGCGTGSFGLRLCKSGYKVVFSDLSQKMLDVTCRKFAEAFPGRTTEFVKADLCDLRALGASRFSLAVAQGDPLSFCGDVRKALSEIGRILRPGGVLVASVDSTFGSVDHFVEAADVAGLDRFLDTGETEWLAKRREERFPVKTFTPDELRRSLERAGFQVLAIVGKPVFDLRKQAALLLDREARRRLLRIEREYGKTSLGLGRGSHLQASARLERS